jgi:1-acyl-sn-glycerol-3-phosphate acyltransferase
MRQLSQDHAYRFRPPRVRRWLRPLLDWTNRRIFLRGKYRVATIECRGLEKVVAAVEAGDAVVLAPNHADHADVHVLYEVLVKAGLEPRFMAARELFDAGKLVAFALQSGGVFSVDRDGADIAAIKTALSILEEGRCPLVIYPEGEIYHHHEWLDPLHDGAAAILLRAAKRLPPGRTAWLFPLAFHFTWDPSVKATFAPRLALLERSLGWKPRVQLPMVERLLRLGGGVLASKEYEFFGEPIGEGRELKERIECLWDALLEDVASRRGCDAKAVTAPERVRSMRARIRRALLDQENPPDDPARRALHEDLWRLHVAFQAYSYPGVYLTGHPTDDRFAETLIKLEEDLLGACTFPVKRTASLVVGDPINVTGFTQEGTATAMALTGKLEERLGGMLEGLRGKDLLGAEEASIVSPPNE